MTTTSFKFYPNHYVPDHDQKYYADHRFDKRRSVISIVFPTFNEEYYELERSIISMHKQEKECEDSHRTEFHYIAILDGWGKASESMKDFVSMLYSSNGKGDKKRAKSDWRKPLEESKDDVSTLVLQKVNKKGFVDLVKINDEVSVRLTVLIKKDNRRKANSHEWFFRTFVNEYNATYAFATDCGTLYAENCMYNLIDHLDKNESSQVVTGRQRVMSSSMQNMPNGGLKAIWYRACQAYDYESSVSSFQGAFSLLGMLPVIPGPCGLYRVDGLEPALDHYFEIVNREKSEIDLLLGNVLLAEDRILSYAAVFNTGKYSRWEPGSIFYFEAETETKPFIAQRRRWTNGSFAGYIHLIKNMVPIIFRSDHSAGFKMATTILLLLQTLSFFFATLSPALFASMLHKTILTLNLNNGDMIAMVYVCCYMGYYVMYSVVHHYHKFVPILYDTILYVNAISMMMVFATILFNLWNMSALVLASIIAVICIPFILSLMHSFDVFIMMIFNTVPFMFFLPTFIAWFSAYAIARISDLSWGNRPSDLHEADDNDFKDKMSRQGTRILLVFMFLNVFLAGAMINFDLIVYTFVVVTLPTIVQQAFSLVFYMFVSSHMLSSVLLKASKNVKRVLGIFITLLTIGILVTSMITPNMLTTRKQIIEKKDIDVEDFTYMHRITNNMCPSLNSGNAFLKEFDETCFYTDTEEIVKSDAEGLNILESYDERYDMYETFSVLSYISTDNPLNHGYQEYYYNTSRIMKNKELIRIEKNIYKKSHFDKEYTTIDFVTFKLEDIVSEKYEKHIVSSYVRPYKILTNDAYVDLKYGILYVNFEYHGVMYKNDTIPWGRNILYEWPNFMWTIVLLTQGIATLFIGCVLISITYTLCSKDKSRIQDSTIMYLFISFVSLLASVIMFQFALSDMNSYILGWWNPEGYEDLTASTLCGNTSGYFDTGECTIGYSYYLSIIALVLLNISYNISRVTVKGNQRKMHLDVISDESEVPESKIEMLSIVDDDNHTIVYVKDRNTYNYKMTEYTENQKAVKFHINN